MLRKFSEGFGRNDSAVGCCAGRGGIELSGTVFPAVIHARENGFKLPRRDARTRRQEERKPACCCRLSVQTRPAMTAAAMGCALRGRYCQVSNNAVAEVRRVTSNASVLLSLKWKSAIRHSLASISHTPDHNNHHSLSVARVLFSASWSISWKKASLIFNGQNVVTQERNDFQGKEIVFTNVPHCSI